MVFLWFLTQPTFGTSVDSVDSGEGFAPEPFVYAVRRPDHHPVPQLTFTAVGEGKDTGKNGGKKTNNSGKLLENYIEKHETTAKQLWKTMENHGEHSEMCEFSIV